MNKITYEELRKAALNVSSARLDHGYYKGMDKAGKTTVQVAGQDLDVKTHLNKTEKMLNRYIDKLIVLTLEYAEQQRAEELERKRLEKTKQTNEQGQ
ncbi:hypothetical protein [Burkholderia multivorans]|uniref:hypothetical protein n=1 Tax=Burkholderia multivorans TaxID=87883 RepID=UPI0015901E5F|nr:hypothetical protein [Burkholderia multivorans]